MAITAASAARNADDWNLQSHLEALGKIVMDDTFTASAAGGYFNQIQNFMLGFDRYDHTLIPANSEYSGWTFITRPRLNLSTIEIGRHREFAPINTLNPMALPFAIRCLLDTKFANSTANMELVAKCPWFDRRSPFNFPLCNALTDISGFPDITIETATTEGGYFCEDQTAGIGYDNLNRTYDLQLNIRDSQGGMVCAIMYYWLMAMGKLFNGTMLAHREDIDQRRMCYTVSIYRFVLDPTKRTVTKYLKATGCFPKSLTTGGMFDVNQSEIFVTTSSKFTIPFVCNKIEINDYAILRDFNKLVRRYCPDIDDPNVYKNYENTPENNFIGIPYIETDGDGIHVVFREKPTNVTRLSDAIGMVSDQVYRQQLNVTTPETAYA